MDPAAKIIVMLDAIGSLCELNHGPKVQPPPAVNALIVPIGDDFLSIPICEDCQEALAGEEWVLLICLDCASSQWIDKSKSRFDYTNKAKGKPHHIIALQGCPKCGNVPSKVHFLD